MLENAALYRWERLYIREVVTKLQTSKCTASVQRVSWHVGKLDEDDYIRNSDLHGSGLRTFNCRP